MTAAAILDFGKALALLGASAAVQDFAIAYLAKMHGHSVEELKAMAAEQRPTWTPPGV